LKSDQDYLAALTGGTVPAGATGTDLLKLQQAQLAVQTAQENWMLPRSLPRSMERSPSRVPCPVPL